MALHEFDDYLSVLRAMLRLGTGRRDAIASELRDHLDERFAELVGQGLTEREAARLALEEFGDAAVLAADFLSISRNSKKRWIMRTTAISMCVLTIAAVAGVTLWPGGDGRSVVSPAVAQTDNAGGGAGSAAGSAGGAGELSGAGAGGGIESSGGGAVGGESGPGGAGGVEGSAGVGGAGAPPPGPGGLLGGGDPAAPGGGQASGGEATQSQRNAKTDIALATLIPADFSETPLNEALATVGDTLGIAFYFDLKALSEAGLAPDVPVSLQLVQVRGDMLLDLVFEQLELGYFVRDGIVIVSTPERLEEVLEVRVYNCRDLLDESTAPRGWGIGWRARGDSSMAGMGPGMRPGMAMGLGAGMGMSAMGSAGMMGSGDMSDASMGGGGMGMGGAAPSHGPISENPKAILLMNILSRTVRSKTWELVGGPAAIAEYGGLLVVKQEPKAHEQIEKLLSMLREADQKEPGAAVRWSR